MIMTIHNLYFVEFIAMVCDNQYKSVKPSNVFYWTSIDTNKIDYKFYFNKKFIVFDDLLEIPLIAIRKVRVFKKLKFRKLLQPADLFGRNFSYTKYDLI